MTQNPINLLIRFLLELVMLGAFAVWGWNIHTGIALRVLIAVATPACAAVIWGVFATPKDVGRATSGPILVSGPLRLAIESALSVVAGVALYASGLHVAAAIYFAVVILQNAASYDRWRLLLR